MAIYKRSESDKQLSKNFKLSELMCKCGQCEEQIVHDDLVSYLQELRDLYGHPIKITSAYRCPNHNENVGGVLNSSHVKGWAADLQCDSLPILEEIIDQMFSEKSLGVYDVFIHTDIRAESKRWNNRTIVKKEYLPKLMSVQEINDAYKKIEDGE